MVCGRFHRAATNPMTLTARKMTPATMISVRCALMTGHLACFATGAVLRHLVDQRGGADAQQDERELEPVEPGKAEEVGVFRVVEKRQQRHDDGDDQQPVPSAAGVGRRAVDGCRVRRSRASDMPGPPSRGIDECRCVDQVNRTLPPKEDLAKTIRPRRSVIRQGVDRGGESR